MLCALFCNNFSRPEKGESVVWSWSIPGSQTALLCFAVNQFNETILKFTVNIRNSRRSLNIQYLLEVHPVVKKITSNHVSPVKLRDFSVTVVTPVYLSYTGRGDRLHGRTSSYTVCDITFQVGNLWLVALLKPNDVNLVDCFHRVNFMLFKLRIGSFW